MSSFPRKIVTPLSKENNLSNEMVTTSEYVDKDTKILMIRKSQWSQSQFQRIKYREMIWLQQVRRFTKVLKY